MWEARFDFIRMCAGCVGGLGAGGLAVGLSCISLELKYVSV